MHLPKPEVFCKVFKDNQSDNAIAKSIKCLRRKNTSLLRINIYEASYKKKVFGYVSLIQDNKHRKFLPSQSMKNY